MNAVCRTAISVAPFLKTITTLDEFEALRADWEKLTCEPLRSFIWHFAWWKNYQHLGQLKILTFEVEGRVVGIAPLFEDHWAGQRRLRFIGSGDTCTDYSDLIVARSWRDQFVTKIVELVNQEVDLLELDGVGDLEPQESFGKHFGNSFWQYQNKIESTWILNLPETWEDFKSAARRSLKRKIKNAEKRLARDEFQVRTTAGDLPSNPVREQRRAWRI